MNLCKLKTVLFDLDGTLLDTAADLGCALNKLLEQQGLAPVSLEKVREVASDGSRALLALGFEMTEDDPRFQLYRMQLIQNYEQCISVNTTLFPGMEQVLCHIENKGITWGVVTNKPTALAKNLLAELNLAERSACIVGGDCTARLKPHPDSLLLACQLTHSLPKECVYIGDAARDIEAAKVAGMRSIVALYGYIGNDSAPESWQADHYIDNPKDIVSWIEKQQSLY